MIAAFALILVCQLFGEVVSELFDLPVPGPVIGLVLLFFGLLIKRKPPKVLTDAADNLLLHFSLLFVPAGAARPVKLKTRGFYRYRRDCVPYRSLKTRRRKR